MTVFNKKDRIEHPMYGSGEIQNVTAVNEKTSILEVFFPETGIRKQLNSQWVEQNCRHYAYVPDETPSKSAFKDGVYLEDATLSNSVWQVFPEKDAVMTEELREGLQYLMSSIAPGINFVMIDPYAAVLLFPEEGTTNEQIEKAARKHMSNVFRHHPDFECMETEDGGVAFFMEQEALCLFIKPELVKRRENGRPSLDMLLAARDVLMTACNEKKMYAIICSTRAE